MSLIGWGPKYQGFLILEAFCGTHKNGPPSCLDSRVLRILMNIVSEVLQVQCQVSSSFQQLR